MLIKKSLSMFFLALALIVPSIAFPQKMDIKDYKVVEGDTLWDIAARELKDPFLWPKIWKENPEIKNPDRIYPGQMIRIPLYLISQEEKVEPQPEPQAMQPEEPKKEAPAPAPQPTARPTPPLVHRNIYASSGSIGDGVGFAGAIDGSPSGRTLYGNGDTVYVKFSGDVKIGDRFYVYHKGKEVFHPQTKLKMGHVIELIGVLEVEMFEFGQTIARILQGFSEIVIGDLVNPYYEMRPPVVSQPFRRPEVNGYVVASRQLKVMNGLYDIVFIDRGQNDGLQPGDLIRTVAVGKHKVPNGLLQVISARETTAAALVVKSTDIITAGDILTKAE